MRRVLWCLLLVVAACDTRVDLATVCDVTTCADGCCLFGQCVPVAQQSIGACGLNGSACAACFGGCNAGRCASGACTTCVFNGFCVPSSNDAACGLGGVACAQCGFSQRCLDGRCQ
ncbi:MAG: hypothetical protein K1X89_27575 [Myxococcaceae bacterium]|nr:hypothetical protein [Myxococcaceae bacterium]